jgi:hypothetical protein
VEESSEPIAPAVDVSCANCGAKLIGEYCFRCGQKRIPPDHLSLRRFVQEAIVHVGDFEHTKIFRTLRALLVRPGLLTTEYIAGKRADWITPLKIFLSIFAISVFLYSAFKSVALYDVSTLFAADHTGVVRKSIERLAERRHIPLEAFIVEVNAKWRTYVSLSQFIYPLLFAFVLMAFYVRQRRYFVEHLVFSMHYQAFALLAVVLAWPLYLLTGLALSRTSAVLALVMSVLMAWYLILAVRKVYGQSWLVSSAKGILLYAGYYFIYTMLTYITMGIAMYAVMRVGVA